MNIIYYKKEDFMDTKAVFEDIRQYRKSRKETQGEFWNRFGLTQPGGSRYEGEQKIPLPTAILLSLFAQGKISEEDINTTLNVVKTCEKVSS